MANLTLNEGEKIAVSGEATKALKALALPECPEIDERTKAGKRQTPGRLELSFQPFDPNLLITCSAINCEAQRHNRHCPFAGNGGIWKMPFAIVLQE